MSGAPDSIKGILLAVRDCYLAGVPQAKDSDLLPKELSKRAGLTATGQVHSAQPVVP